MRNLNQEHIQNNSFVSVLQEKHNKELLKDYYKARGTGKDTKIYLNHLKQYKEFKDITEEEKEREEFIYSLNN